MLTLLPLWRRRRRDEEQAPALSGDLRRRVRGIELRARRLVASRILGDYRSVFRGRGIEFSDVREYQPGDDVRLIDWNVTARTGTPYVKKYVEERDLTVMLAVDASGSAAIGTQGRSKAAYAADVAALLTFAAVANNDRAGLLVFSDRIERFVRPGRGSRHALRIVRDLLLLRPAGRGTDLGQAATFLVRTLRRRSAVFFLSDFIDPAFDEAMRRLAARHDVVGVTITDPREIELPDVGLLTARDAETGASITLDTSDPDVRRAYAGRARELAERRRRRLASLGIEEIALRTDRDYIGPLARFLEQRARR
jgi:uncharacterized protein (DUF58 family)